MKTPQVLKRTSFFVLVCPECKSEKVDTFGEGGFGVFDSRSEVKEALGDTDGDTLSQKIANTCSNICGTKHEHRHCHERPCGYCQDKGVEWIKDYKGYKKS